MSHKVTNVGVITLEKNMLGETRTGPSFQQLQHLKAGQKRKCQEKTRKTRAAVAKRPNMRRFPGEE